MRVQNPPTFICRFHLLQLENRHDHPQFMEVRGKPKVENITKCNYQLFSIARFFFPLLNLFFIQKPSALIKTFPP